MRNPADTRSLASMNLPDGFSFFLNADHAELVTPDGTRIPFGEGFSVSAVEAVAYERAGEVIRNHEPDLHSLVTEALNATGWGEERREAFLMDFLYALCVEAEEMARIDEEWRDGTESEDDPVGRWAR